MKRTFLIVSGGTGGHVSPGISVFKVLSSKYENVFFVTNPHALEFPIVKENVPSDKTFVIPISRGFSRRNLFRNVLTLIDFIKSFFISLIIILKVKPDLIISSGGYASAAVGVAGVLLGRSLILLEQNSIIGTTNKILSLFSKKVILTFPVEKISKKHVIIGNPVRFQENDIITKEEATRLLNVNFENDLKTLGIVGGSQGAKFINEFFLSHVEIISKKYNIIWITGKDYFEKVVNNVKLDNVKIFPFITEMNRFFCAIDICISRSGASTLSEVSFFGVPCILIPFPLAKKNHQYYNAIYFERKGGGIVIEQKDVNVEIILESLKKIEKNISEFRENSRNVFPRNVTEKILEEIDKIF